MSNTSQSRAVNNYRKRLQHRGMARFERSRLAKGHIAE